MSTDIPEPTGFEALMLRTVFGDRVDALASERRAALTAEFMRGGTHAVLARSGSAREAASALAYARELSGAARERLAAETTTYSESAFVEREWQAAYTALHESREQLAGIRGVVGFGPGYRRCRGLHTPERCVVVYVERKRTPAQLRRTKGTAVPPVLTADDGTGVPTDVVELGRLRRHAFAGASIGPAGRSRRGTIGAFARDLTEGGPVALTAMHVIAPNPGEVVDCVCPGRGLPGSASLGRFRRGTLDRIDAAVVGADRATSIQNVLPGLGPIRGFRPVSLPGDINRPVRMIGAETGRMVDGVILDPLVHLPRERLESAILARIHSVEGDSGAALVDSSNLVLGFLVGEAGPRHAPVRIFSPAALVLQLLGCDLPSVEA
jgi:hypothetical protein